MSVILSLSLSLHPVSVLAADMVCLLALTSATLVKNSAVILDAAQRKERF